MTNLPLFRVIADKETGEWLSATRDGAVDRAEHFAKSDDAGTHYDTAELILDEDGNILKGAAPFDAEDTTCAIVMTFAA